MFVPNPSLGHWEWRLFTLGKFMKSWILWISSIFFIVSFYKTGYCCLWFRRKQLCWRKSSSISNIQLGMLPIIEFLSGWWSKSHNICFTNLLICGVTQSYLGMICNFQWNPDHKRYFKAILALFQLFMWHSVHQGINPPSKTPPPSFLPSLSPSPPLNLQTVQAPLFRQSSPSVSVFCEPLKIW